MFSRVKLNFINVIWASALASESVWITLREIQTKLVLKVFLPIITVFMRLVCVRRRNRFQQRLRLRALRGRRIVTEANFHHSQRKICPRRKIAWVLERPQFWFKTTTKATFGTNISVSLRKRSGSFLSNFVSCFDQTRGRFKWRSEYLLYFDLTALSYE